MSLITIRDLVVEAPGTASNAPLLHHVNLDIPVNRIIGLTGPSGSGKTLLAKYLTAFLPANLSITNGSLFYRGTQIKYSRLKKYRGNTIFYTPQNPVAALNPLVKIKYQMIEALHPPPTTEQMQSLLEDLDIHSPSRILNSYSFQLSEGQCQRVVLAMALLLKPQLLILDEPLASLDLHAASRFLKQLQYIKNKFNIAVLLISHNIPLIQPICSSFYCMTEGRLNPAASQKSDASENEISSMSQPSL